MAGWNFYLYEALLIPFEITALDVVLGFWRDDIPVAAVCAACVVLYGFVIPFTIHKLWPFPLRATPLIALKRHY